MPNSSESHTNIFNDTAIAANITNEALIDEDVPELDRAAWKGGVILQLLVCFIALLIAIWVVINRKTAVIRAMQPQFLILMCVGIILERVAILPFSVNESNNSINVNGSCLTGIWLSSIGTSLFYSALFSKLLRINKLFHAGGFQRKTVKMRDVLLPLVVLLSMNLLILILITTIDPPVFKYDLEDGDYRVNCVGFCTFESGGIGASLNSVLLSLHFLALVILCVQAYRARDIRSEFSEARGVALGLFSRLQALIISVPMFILIEDDNLEAQHMLSILSDFVPSVAFMFFIFAPIVSSHRQRRRSTLGSTTHVSGLSENTNRLTSSLSEEPKNLF